MKNKKYKIPFCILHFALCILNSCSGGGCPLWRNNDTVTDVNSDQLSLSLPQQVIIAQRRAPVLRPAVKIAPPPAPKPAAKSVTPPAEDVISNLTQSGPPPVPPGTFQAEDLTMRLREKMAEAYGGDVKRVPNATIYLSNGTLEEFISFYEERGYHVQRVTVPVQRILQPVLRDKPELADRIHLENYADAAIHQAMVEGTGISAADKYIDPDSYEIVDRLFVTEMPMK